MRDERDLAERGRRGEEAFKQWLNQCRRAFVHVNQERDMFASLFSKNLKRPDFLVLIDSVGLLAVDVKNRRLNRKGDRVFYTLPRDAELKPTLAFERIFRLPMWYAFASTDDSGWYWISALRAVETGTERINRGETYLEIELHQFANLKNGGFGLLFNHVLPTIDRLADVSLFQRK